MNTTETISPQLYIPSGCSTLDNIKVDPQIRLGIQGPPGIGKTWAALTFPNPVVLNNDRGLGAHVGRKDVVEVPMHNPAFVDKVVKRTGLTCPPNRKDANLIWINTEGMKLSPKQTLVVENCTQLQNSFVVQYNLEPVIAKSGKVDDRAIWSCKIDYFGQVCDLLKSVPCNVVITAHETPDRDDAGEYNNRVRPLLSGQFGDQLASHFTDWFRAHAITKPPVEKIGKFKEVYGLDEATYQEWINSTPANCATIYIWQTMSCEIAKCKTSTLVGAPKFVLAHHSVFAKYKRKVNN